MKARKSVLMSIVLAGISSVTLFAVACGEDEQPVAPKTYTVSFVTDGGTEIAPISAVGGSMIFAPNAPKKSGYTFEGWYTDAAFGGEAVELPNVMPKENVTYYAKFDPITAEYTVTYEYNIGKAPHTAEIPSVTVKAGDSVTVADGNDYGAEDYMFMGWSVYPNGFVSDVVQPGQYNAGDELTLTDSNITLYAQWAAAYTDMRGVNNDKIYVYAPLIGSENEAALLVRADKNKKNIYGVIASSEQTESGYNEFTFRSAEFDGGVFTGRLNANRTYAISDGMQGEYAQYDYVFGNTLDSYILELDGFGNATYTEIVGDTRFESSTGDYVYDADRGCYKFTYSSQTDEDGAARQTAHFSLEQKKVADTDFVGVFTLMGAEKASYLLYEAGSGIRQPNFWIMQLDGYGNAKIDKYNRTGSAIEKTVTGKYNGTDNYESPEGEWLFDSDKPADQADFKFIVTVAPSGSNYYYVFLMRDESMIGTYTADDGSILYLDGYGAGEYIADGVSYEGNCTIKDGEVTFTIINTNSDGSYTAGQTVMFALDGKKFTVGNGTDFKKDDDNTNKITGYYGNSAVVVIPDGVTEIGDDAFSQVKNKGGLSLVSVTVPATVTNVGVRAFQNDKTLRRAIFLSETPIELDFSPANDPFRWSADDFLIVVPNKDAVAAYKEKWTAYADKIVAADQVSSVPDFEVQDGVLIGYHNDQSTDVKLPDDVTEIADGVFMGMKNIKSVDLNNVVKVGDSAFYGCINLETVKMPKVESLGVMAFSDCAKLNNSGTKDVLELSAIKTVGERAFSGCNALRCVKLGKELEQIDALAFYLCNVYNDTALTIELTGDKAPVMGNKVTLGNAAVKIVVESVKVAVKCYKEKSWENYTRLLFVESDKGRGVYMSGSDMLVLDGNATYYTSTSSYVWMYDINESAIKFYENGGDGKVEAIVGTYKDDVITVAIGSKTRRFARVSDDSQFTYKSIDGSYTLVCNPNDLRPENLEAGSGDIDVTLNGKKVKLNLDSDGTKTIYEYKDADGKVYDITITFDAETLSIFKKLSPVRYELTAADKSKITVLIQNGNVYIEKAEFAIDVDNGGKLRWTAASGMAVTAQKNGNTYTFSLRFRNTEYSFTVTASEDNKTFTYTKN